MNVKQDEKHPNFTKAPVWVEHGRKVKNKSLGQPKTE